MQTRNYTSKVLSVLEKHSSSKPSCLVFEAELVNYTPYMGGDFDTKTWHKDANEKMFVGYPSSQSLRGRMRWLARLVIASLKGCDANSYVDVEKNCFPLMLKIIDEKGRSRKLKYGFIELLFGSIGVAGEPEEYRAEAVASLFNIVVEPVMEPRSSDAWNPESPEVTIIMHEAGIRYRGGHYPDRYFALIRRGRREEGDVDVEELRPARSGSVRIRLKIYLASHAPRILDLIEGEKKPSLSSLADFYVSLALIVLTIFGIGRGVTRGFGRFIPEHVEFIETSSCGHNVKLELKHAKRILGLLNSLRRVGEAENAHEILEEILWELICACRDALSYAKDADVKDKVEKPPRIPMLASALKPVISSLQDVRLKVIQVNCVKSIDGVMELIAISVLKQAWKQLYSELRGRRHGRAFATTGIRFHTWVLGLPRGAPIKCVCPCQGHYRGNDLRERFGYYVFPVEVLQENYHIDCIGNFCVASSECTDYRTSCMFKQPSLSKVDEDSRRVLQSLLKGSVKASTVRRQSPFILFPLPSCKPMVAVLPLVSYDIDLVGHTYYKNLRLYHAGGHFEGQGRSPPPCCHAHLVDVSFALRTCSIKHQCTCGAGCEDYGHAGATVRDKGGYVYIREEDGRYHAISTVYDDTSVDRDAFSVLVESAYKWIIACLNKFGGRLQTREVRLHAREDIPSRSPSC